MPTPALGCSLRRDPQQRIVSTAAIGEEVADIADQAERLGVMPLPPDELAQLAVGDYRRAGFRVTGDLGDPDHQSPAALPPSPKV